VHGLNVNDGIEDRDEMGVCVEPFASAMSLGDPFEQFIYRSAAEREGRHDARSSAGDLDLTIYSLRKWMRLALKGNPTILLLLFTPDEQLVTCDALGAELRALAPAIVSRRAQQPFLGYLQAQKQRLTGERGQKRVHRPELEAMYGFDTKYAMHMLRLGFQGVELLTTGRLNLPMTEPSRSFLLDVRRGKVSEQECLARAGELEERLTQLATTSSLPPEPEETHVEGWMLSAYRRRWDIR
ncbi:MAG: nucleotidyltransferase domain-containing protein, partial [Acidobacteria bacterium]|nr:nucleotidyltransferase domain-containing protein [Acidobacteriota bacterium]